MSDLFEVSLFLDIFVLVFIWVWPSVAYFLLRKDCKALEARISTMEARGNLEPWISIKTRKPLEHDFIEAMVPEGGQHQLVEKVIMFNGNVGGIKFWRPIKEGGK